ncbi:MAG: pyridoxal-phosphate dependent enzyme [Luteimonas sp.]|nr:pyridoxal-phosphate dependent enzyme [Luteimonas sp.]
MNAPSALPSYTDVLAAAARIAPQAHATPVLHSRSLDADLGCMLSFKAEHLQRGGAFKFRGACNAVSMLGDDGGARGVVTHSSGNHGGALALAARLRGIPCHVVVPEGAVRSKLAAIEAQGATVHRCAASIAAREAMCEAVQRDTGAEVVHPYADPRVIAGQGTAALELLREQPLDVLVVPVGGGGLAAGTAITVAAMSPATTLILAEPAGADDTLQSLQHGRRMVDFTPNTICDGLRGTLGAPNFEILRRHAPEVVAVSDDDTRAAMRLLFQRTKALVEPSSAIAFAVVMANATRFAGLRVGVVLTGGNLDPDALPW